jgi:hypothetical protein
MSISPGDNRFWHQLMFRDRNSRPYQLSFRVAEEGTWDHRFHDVDGAVLNPDDLWLSQEDFLKIQPMCDNGVGGELVVQASSISHTPALRQRIGAADLSGISKLQHERMPPQTG